MRCRHVSHESRIKAQHGSPNMEKIFERHVGHLFGGCRQPQRHMSCPRVSSNGSQQQTKEITRYGRRNLLGLLGSYLLVHERESRAATLPRVGYLEQEVGGMSASMQLPDYTQRGPCESIRLPRLEHTCTTCNSPADRCRIRINAWVPKGSATNLGLQGPFPLAIISPGFLIDPSQYSSYAERLASWGYVAVTYDMAQQAFSPTSDVECVSLLLELVGWCKTSYPLGSLCDAENVLLIGHSRGAKIATLAAAQDDRVKALFLLDPVDITVYTPDGPGFPSATEALVRSPLNGRRSLPIAIIGSGHGGDCAPTESSFDLFYRAANGPTWETVISDAGHLQFLDQRYATAMGLVCQASGQVTDEEVEAVAYGVMITWAENMMKRKSILVTNNRGETEEVPQRIVLSDGKIRVAGTHEVVLEREALHSVQDVAQHIRSQLENIPITFETKNFMQ